MMAKMGSLLFRKGEQFFAVATYWSYVAVTMAQGTNIEFLGQVGGQCRAVQVVGDFAYMGEGPNLVVLDVSDPANPVIRTKVLLRGLVTELFVSGDVAYVVNGGRLQIVSVADPDKPVLRGSTDLSRSPTAIDVHNGYAYLTWGGGPWYGSGGLRIVDVRNIDAPKPMGMTSTPSGATDVEVSGQFAYVTWMITPSNENRGGLVVVDVSDPAAPFLRGTHDTVAEAYGLSVANGVAYVCADWAGLWVFDISNPDTPVRIGHASYPYPTEVRILGNLAYLYGGRSGTEVSVVDVTTPSAPVLRGEVETEQTASDFSVSDGWAYVARPWTGLHTFDVSDPTSLVERGRYVAVGHMDGVFLSKEFAYVADKSTGLRIIDIGDPTFPKIRTPDLSEFNLTPVCRSSADRFPDNGSPIR